MPLIRVAPASSTLRVAVGDVTNDRHPDVLVEQYPHTNHGCGPHEVVATLRNGRTVRAFRDATLCETTLYGVDGLLALDLPVYDRNDGVCCWSKVRKLRLRWQRDHYVVASDRTVKR